MPLDETTKEKYKQIYLDWGKGWTQGESPCILTPDWYEEHCTDDVVQENTNMPEIVGKQANIDALAGWSSMIAIIHNNIHIYVTDDGWVNAFITASLSYWNADKSKQFLSHVKGCLNRLHFNDEGKVDRVQCLWDNGEVLANMMSTAGT